MTFELTLLGTNAALPLPGRNPSAQVLQIQHYHFLIDCGEGTQVRLVEYGVRHHRIEQIFISHLHGDHFYGLIGLLTSWQLSGRESPLSIFSPPGLEAAIQGMLDLSDTRLAYPVLFHPLDTGTFQLIYANPQVEVFSIPLDHRIPTTGFLFRELPRPANILPEKIAEYDIPFEVIPSIKGGADYVLPDGRRIPHTELTRPGRPPRSYAYCSDTRFRPELAPLIRGIDLLYHESTFLEADAARARETMHSTAREAALLARDAGVRRLVLGHFSIRYTETAAFEEEARVVFPETIAGRDGMKITVD